MAFDTIKKLFAKKQEDTMDQSMTDPNQPSANPADNTAQSNPPNNDQPLANNDDPAMPIDPTEPVEDNNQFDTPVDADLPSDDSQTADSPPPVGPGSQPVGGMPQPAIPSTPVPEPNPTPVQPPVTPPPPPPTSGTQPSAPPASPSAPEIKVDSKQFEEPADPMAKFDNTGQTDLKPTEEENPVV